MNQPDRATDRAWDAWIDWCAATDHDHRSVVDEALNRFARQVPRTPVRLVRAAARNRSLLPRSDRDPWTIAERTWAPLRLSLTRCPIYGWPTAVPGRRDAWLIAVTRVLRLPRRQAVGLRAGHAHSVLDRLPSAPVDGVCLRCVAKRWFDTVLTQDRWSRAEVRTQVWARPAQAAARGEGSARPCDGSCDDVAALLDQMPAHAVLAPAVDQHGWWTDWRPMTSRALTGVLAARCDRYGAAPEPEPVEPDVETLDPVVFDDTTLDRLDEAMAAMDVVNARLEALFAEFDVSPGPSARPGG